MEIKKLLEHRKLIKSRKPRFLRKDWHKISNLGLRRKNKQVWRKAKGRHNKLREKKKSHGKNPSIGYRSPRLIRGSINGLMPVLVKNVQDLKKVGKENIAVIANIGLKKKIEVVKKAEEMKISIMLNTKKFLKEAEKRVSKITQNRLEKKGKGAEKPKQEKSEKKQEETKNTEPNEASKVEQK